MFAFCLVPLERRRDAAWSGQSEGEMRRQKESAGEPIKP